jgi:terminase small subunit-like protein
MSGNPLKRRVLDALRSRAAVLGDEGDVLAYAVDYIASGGRISELARDLAQEIGSPVSRPLVSGILNDLAPDATQRLEAARREGAYALVDEAITIADGAEATTAGVQKAGLQTRVRQWTAEKWNAAELGQKAGAVNVSIGSLLLEALMQPPPPRPLSLGGQTVDAEMLSSEESDETED